jgi:hypothetical protein
LLEVLEEEVAITPDARLVEIYAKAVLARALPDSVDLELPVVLTQIRTDRVRIRRAVECCGDAKEDQISFFVPPLETKLRGRTCSCEPEKGVDATARTRAPTKIETRTI